MKNSKFSLLLVLTIVFSLILSACSGGGDNAGSKDKDSNKSVKQEITVLETAEIPTMDSVLAEGTTSFTALNNTNEGLYRLNQDQQTELAIAAEDPKVNADKTVYTFTLKDTKWSNGEPVTANDFVFAWKRAIDPKTASSYGPYMMAGKIKNASKITDAATAKKPYNLDELGVKALDDKTLEITFENPLTEEFVKSYLAFPTFYPQNEKFVTEKGKDYAKNAENLLYNGPFKLTQWKGATASEWVYEKNENYWDAKTVKLEKISFNVVKDPNSMVNAFEAGDADITGKLSSDLVPNFEGDDRLVRWLEPTVFWLKLNTTKNPALKNKNIRLAIAQGFNKKDLTEGVLANGSIPANYAVPKDFVKHPETGEDFREGNGDMLTYNLDAAKKAWEQGLKELGTKEVTIGLLGGDTEAGKKVDEYIVNQLETNLPGLKIKLESVPFGVRLDRDTKMDYDMQDAGWGPDYLDPISFSDLWVTGGGNNRMGYSNPEYDKRIKAALTTLGGKPAERWEALQEAEKILMEDAAIAPIYQRASNLLIAPKVKGFTYHLFGPEYSYKWVSVEGE
ncbi:peptide ABC transporter substrate-binding protein [Peribacillus sp. SCS-155]|uniref:peptide ABC transporter substrate-binding protein n=1 Tax=Peribacillus sedimenti TaxID=3115297 RepID=UPI0039060B0B